MAEEIKNKLLVVIAGPTAVGKTALAIALAQFYKTEILSADSRQFYQEMSIITAKPSSEELSMVKHHFINSHSIHEEFSVGQYEKEALQRLDVLFKRHSIVLMVGGSGLYIKALCDGIDSMPEIPVGVRDAINQTYQQQGLEPLLEELKEKDADYFELVDKNNPQRIIRALEVIRASGQRYTTFRVGFKKNRPFGILKLAINTDRAMLYERINQRVEQMLAQGLINEVERLMPFRHLNALQTVGFNEFVPYFEGNISREVAVELLKKNTRNYAKRQLTWFRKDKDYHWFLPTEMDEIKKIIDFNLHKT
jgi:tRNA dimethylallyltransferase